MNKIWALSDIHLPGNSHRTMDKYGSVWKNHSKVILENVRTHCDKDDILLIPGDISWAKDLASMKSDLEYLSEFPCFVVMCSGNHDSWSAKIPRSTIEKAFPSNVIWVEDVCFRIGNVAISGCCFWEFKNIFPWPGHVAISNCNIQKKQKEALVKYNKALKILPQNNEIIKILMLHVPPIPFDAKPYTFSSEIAEKNIDFCVFGHAHGVNEFIPACETQIDGTKYVFCACDWLKMMPKKICEFENDSNPFIIDENGKISYLKNQPF